MKKTVIIQGSKEKNLYFNLPKKIVQEMKIERGETAIIEVVDKDTMLIKFIEE